MEESDEGGHRRDYRSSEGENEQMREGRERPSSSDQSMRLEDPHLHALGEFRLLYRGPGCCGLPAASLRPGVPSPSAHAPAVCHPASVAIATLISVKIFFYVG